jgi:hypothetical protein
MPIKAILKTNNKINNKTNNRTNNIINNKTNNKTNNIINNKTNNINNNKINEDSYLDKINEFCTIYSTNNNFIISNPKIEFRYFCYKYIDNIQNIKLQDVPKESIYESVLIEFRIFPHIEFIIRNNILKLGSDWSYTIVCGNLNFDFITTMCSSISESIKIIKLNYDIVTPFTYSEILTSIDFWNLFKGEKILIHQEDSIIFKDNIKDFIQWDYIGAPWSKKNIINYNNIGNGGFSLRNKQCMIDIINKNSNSKLVVHPENVYFTKSMIDMKIGNIADYDTATLFSSEIFFNPDSFGGQCFWLGNKKWKKYLLENLNKIFIDNDIEKIFNKIIQNNQVNSINNEKDYQLNIYENKEISNKQYEFIKIKDLLNTEYEKKLINFITENLSADKKTVFCIHQFELGDAIILNGLYRYLLTNYNYVVIAVRIEYYEQIKIMYLDEKNILFYVLKQDDKMDYYNNINKLIPYTDKIRNIFVKYNITFKPMGHHICKYFKVNMNESSGYPTFLYKNHGYNIQTIQYNFFKINRNLEAEEILYNKLINIIGENYIIVIDDEERNFKISNIYSKEDLPIFKIGLDSINNNKDLESIKDKNIFNYIKILEKAKEVHSIHSSIILIVEHLKLDIKKCFIHNKVRPNNNIKYNNKNIIIIK